MKKIPDRNGGFITVDSVVNAVNSGFCARVTAEDLKRLFTEDDAEDKSELCEKLKKELGEMLNRYHRDGVSAEAIYETLKEKTAFAEFAAFGKW